LISTEAFFLPNILGAMKINNAYLVTMLSLTLLVQRRKSAK